MKRLAVFVEGQTEQLFVEKLIRAIAGDRNVRFELRRITGGATTRRRMLLLEAVAEDTGEQYYVLLVDCGGDETVKTRIREEYDGLARQGYAAIIGLRDVRPRPRTDIPEIVRRLALYVRTSPIRVEFVLAIMEIEAWFLAEHTHFEKLAATLSIDAIVAALGFNPSADDMAQRDEPANDLDGIYRLAGLRYTKNRARVQRTVQVLDYARLYLELGERYSNLQALVTSIESFLS